jgi:ABC-2 type transport system permease protein
LKQIELAQEIWKNPVIVKDVRTRMRGVKSFILITSHLAFLTIALAVAYFLYSSSLTSSGNLEARRIFGKSIFGLLIFLELVMISFVAPALTSGSISAERERQTLDLLRVTLLPPHQLILGKFLPGLAFLILLLFTAIPLQGPAFLIGGVLWQEIVLATMILIMTAISFCALGLLLSSLIRRTLISTTVCYAISIFIMFGIPVILIFFSTIVGIGLTEGINSISPFALKILIFIAWCLVSFSPIGAIVGTEAILLDQGSLLFVNLPLNNTSVIILPSPWIPFVISYLLFSLAALWLSSQLALNVDQ